MGRGAGGDGDAARDDDRDGDARDLLLDALADCKIERDGEPARETDGETEVLSALDLDAERVRVRDRDARETLADFEHERERDGDACETLADAETEGERDSDARETLRDRVRETDCACAPRGSEATRRSASATAASDNWKPRTALQRPLPRHDAHAGWPGSILFLLHEGREESVRAASAGRRQARGKRRKAGPQ